MFLVNSRLGHFTAASFAFPREAVQLLEALLIPKLRSHVAEFLHKRSLERLRILISPTCVSFSTGMYVVEHRLFLTLLPMTSESYMSSALRHGVF